DDQVLATLPRLAALNEAKEVAAANTGRTKRMHAARVADDCVAPCNALIPARAEEVFEHGPVCAALDTQLTALEGQGARNRVLYLQPGQGQQFGVFHYERERHHLAEEDAPLAQISIEAQIAQAVARPDIGGQQDEQAEQGHHQQQGLAYEQAEECERDAGNIPSSTHD